MVLILRAEFQELLEFFYAPLLILNEVANALATICLDSEIVDSDANLFLEELDRQLVRVYIILNFSEPIGIALSFFKLALLNDQAFVLRNKIVSFF